MKKFITAFALTAMVGTAASAGNPEVGQDDDMVAPLPVAGSSLAGTAPAIIGGLVLAAALASGSSSTTTD